MAEAPPHLEKALADRYRLERSLGSGGMATVYLAWDLRHDRQVAVKVLDPELAAALGPERFLREIGIAGRLNHPHVLPMLDSGVSGGFFYYVMPFAQGESLRDRLRREIQLPVEEAVLVASEVADALDYAHRQGIVHRDIKPENVLLQSGHAVVADFGIARAVGESGKASLTASGVMIGTPAYISPEQVTRGREVDGRADLYSLGCVLYEMLAGQAPFVAPTAEGIVHQHLSVEAPAVTQLRPATSAALTEVVRRLLAKAPADRYANGAQLVAALRSAIAATSATSGGTAMAVGQEPLAPTVAMGRSTRRTMLWSSVAAVLIALLAAGLFYQGRRAKPGTLAGARGVAIVVLPFANLSADRDQEYFSDGLSEELLNVLSRNPKLRVTSRTSAFSFKGKNVDVKAIAERLHVTHVLEGSVRKAGNAVRITAQLIEVATDSHLWSQTYDRQLENIFAVQDDIAASVASALRITLEGRRSPGTQKTSPEAYNAYLQGRYFSERRTKADFEKAIDFYEQALRIDPNLARAWVGLSSVHSFQADWGLAPLREGYARARKEIETALALDPDMADAYAQLGWIEVTYDWDWAGADSAYKRALELEPSNARVIQSAAWLAGTLGRREEAVRLCRRAIALDPLLIAAYNNLGTQAYYAGLLDEAESAFRKALAMNPQFPGIHANLSQIDLARSKPQEAVAEMQKESQDWRRLFGLALVYHAAGRTQEADAAQAEYMKKYGDVGAYQAAEIYAFRGEADKAFEWLERAYEQRDGGLAEIKGDPLLRGIERDPRYRAFLRKMRLPLD